MIKLSECKKYIEFRGEDAQWITNNKKWTNTRFEYLCRIPIPPELQPQPVGEWISVEKELPDCNKYYEVSFPDKTTGYVQFIEWDFQVGDYLKPCHWFKPAPIPAPPKVEDDIDGKVEMFLSKNPNFISRSYEITTRDYLKRFAGFLAAEKGEK